jgi:acyl-coenzyme A synthetase/AMP-(fatty) acid ligase
MDLPSLRQSSRMTPLSLSRLLDGFRPPEHPVAIRNGGVLTTARFAGHAVGVSEKLRTNGLRRAALLCNDSCSFAVGLFGALAANADIVIPANGQPGTLESLRGTFDVLIDDAYVASTEDVSGSHCRIDGERPALMFFTSGSTGEPKRVLKSLGMFEREAVALETTFGANSGDGPVLAMVPHQHVYGLTFKLTWPLATGRPFAADTHATWETLLATTVPGATIVSSPAFLSRCTGLPPLPEDRRPGRVFSAGAPLSFVAAKDAESVLGVHPTEIFGSTETGAFATRTQSRDDEPWRLLPGVEMRCDSDGRLSLRSPTIGPDWYETADLVEPNDAGFRFRGRADRIVKIEGKRVSLAAIEESLVRLPWISAAAVLVVPGKPDRLGAAVVLTDPGREQLSGLGAFRFGRLLRSALSSEHEPAGSPRLWRFVDTLPTAELGKRRNSDLHLLFTTART